MPTDPREAVTSAPSTSRLDRSAAVSPHSAPTQYATEAPDDT